MNGSERFVQRAAERGLEIEVSSFPDGTRTAADAAGAIGCQVAQIVKSLVFIADGHAVLALVAGDDRVDEAAVAGVLGAGTVRKADAAEARGATGYAIGGTPPFGHDEPLTTLCDRALIRHEQVWAAAGSATDVFPIDPEQLVRVAAARLVDIAV